MRILIELFFVVNFIKINKNIKYESKIDEKNKMLRSIEFSNSNLVGELKDKITLLNQIIDNKDSQIKQTIDTFKERERDKIAKKKDKDKEKERERERERVIIDDSKYKT